MMFQRVKNALRWILGFPFSSSRAQSPKSHAEQQARDVLSYLENGAWTLLRQQFAAPLRFILSESMLERGWNTITSTTGPLNHTSDPVVTNGWFGTSARVSLQFNHSRLAIILRMTPSGKLFGLRIAPEPSLPWKMPPYTIAEVEEIALTVGVTFKHVRAALTMPPRNERTEKIPCIILVSGSGPVDKDSSVGALKPFKDLAFGLASRGIAVLRFDKFTSTLLGKIRLRGKKVTLHDEYVYHVQEAIKQVRRRPEIDAGRIVLVGHSLGALIAARLVSNETSIAGCALMACPAEPMYRCAIRQIRFLSSIGVEKTGQTDGSVSQTNPVLQELERQAEAADSPALSLSTPANQLPFGIGPAYWLQYREFNPLETLPNVRKPVLVLQGGRDYQVTVKEDYAALSSTLQDHTNVEFHIYEKLNHLFVAGQGTPTPLEYEEPGNVSIEVVRDIEQWVKKLPHREDF